VSGECGKRETPTAFPTCRWSLASSSSPSDSRRLSTRSVTRSARCRYRAVRRHGAVRARAHCVPPPDSHLLSAADNRGGRVLKRTQPGPATLADEARGSNTRHGYGSHHTARIRRAGCLRTQDRRRVSHAEGTGPGVDPVDWMLVSKLIRWDAHSKPSTRDASSTSMRCARNSAPPRRRNHRNPNCCDWHCARPEMGRW
jgi:hypothetical protein